MSAIVSTYVAAARSVDAAVAQVGAEAWDRPGLGDWSVRDLVGHTSRSLVTVIDYLARPFPREVVPSAADYLLEITRSTFDPGDVAERGRQAGRDLGDDPAARFHDLVDQAATVAEAADPDLVVHTIFGGMRVAVYLPTRTFELCVHGLDLAAATGVDVDLPPRALEEAAALAAVAAVRRGRGDELLRAVTGRTELPPGFSVV